MSYKQVDKVYELHCDIVALGIFSKIRKLTVWQFCPMSRNNFMKFYDGGLRLSVVCVNDHNEFLISWMSISNLNISRGDLLLTKITK